MPTLPQTSNVRLPRPANGELQAVRQSGALGHPAAGQQNQSHGSNEAWRVIRAHIWMIIIVTGILAPSAGLAANWWLAQNYSRYTSEAFIEVKPAVDPNSVRLGGQPTAATSPNALEIRTQAQYLRHESLLIKVLTDPNSEIRKTQWWKQFNNDVRKAKTGLEDNLDVSPIAETKLVRVRFTDSVPED